MAKFRIRFPQAAAATSSKRPAATRAASSRTASSRTKGTRRGRGWKFYVLLAVTIPCLLVMAVTAYYYVTLASLIDARLHGEFQRADPRVFARPFEIRRGQSLTPHQLVDRLNDLGYAHRTRAEQSGEFTIGRDTILIVPRDGQSNGKLARVHFAAAAKGKEPQGIDYIEPAGGGKKWDSLILETPMITALVATGREKRRDVPLAQVPPHVVQAVLAIEDRRFYEHPGIDPIAITGAVFNYVFGDKSYMRGASTLTQQLVKNTFLTQDRTAKRKFQEWIMSVALERRLNKDQVLELYLNDVWLGQRGSFAIHGVPEASRLFFGKDIANVSLSEAATIAGTIQSPIRHSPFNNGERAKERRNVVLKAMADASFISQDAAQRASREPLRVAARSLEMEGAGYRPPVERGKEGHYSLLYRLDERMDRVPVLPGEELPAPERTSTGVLARPLLQDFVFEPAAFVGGPAEVAYYAQLRPLHGMLEVRAPEVMLRGHVLVAPAKRLRVLEDYDIAVTELFEPLDEVLGRRPSAGLDVLARERDAAGEELDRAAARIRDLALAADPALQRSMSRSSRRMRFHLEKMSERASRAIIRRDGERWSALERLQQILAPERQPQDRIAGWIGWWQTYGTGLFESLVEAAEPGQPVVRVAGL